MEIVRFFSVRVVLFFAVVFGVCFCERAEVSEDGRVDVVFEVISPMDTKAGTGTDGEKDIHSVDLLVFRSESGLLDYYGRVTESQQISGSLTSGEDLEWYLVANVPEGRLSSVMHKSVFLGMKTYLSDMGSDSMVMSVNGECRLDGKKPVVTVGPVEMVRYCCKVSVGNIRVEWLDSYENTPECSLDRVVVMNARTAIPFSGVAEAPADGWWANRLSDEGLDAGDGSVVGCFVYDSRKVVIASSASTSVGSVFYVMPNPSTGTQIASDVPWSPRQTRVCFLVSVDGVPQWYSVNLPPMTRNGHYQIAEVVIKGPGTLSIDMGIDRTVVDFTCHVKAWGSNESELVFPRTLS